MWSPYYGLAQSVEYETLNLMVVGSCPTLGATYNVPFIVLGCICFYLLSKSLPLPLSYWVSRKLMASGVILIIYSPIPFQALLEPSALVWHVCLLLFILSSHPTPACVIKFTSRKTYLEETFIWGSTVSIQ